MKIVQTGVFNPNSTSYSQANAFERIKDVELIKFEIRKYPNYNYDKDLINLCQEEMPDLLLLCKCQEMDNRVIREVQSMGVKCYFWFMDILDYFSNNTNERIEICDHSFFASHDAFYHSLKISDKCSFLHEGFDADIDYPRDVSKTIDVSFIGNLREERKRYKEIEFELFSDAYGKRHAEVVSSSKINLNLIGKGGGTSDRVYKILATKGFLLTEPWPDMENDFKIGVDLDIFTSPEELQEKIYYYLMNTEARDRISSNGYNSVQKFNRDEWCLKIIEKLKKGKGTSFFKHDTSIVESDDIGEGTKIWAYSHICKGAKIGKNCVIGESVYIGPEVVIGDGCKIQNQCLIYKGLTIGNEVFIGPNVVTTNDIRPRATGDWDDRFRETKICDKASIGANSTILCGIELGYNCMIGAASAVTKSVMPNSLVRGNPARHVGWVNDKEEVVKKIMILYPHGLGDCIMAIPALRQLKREGYTICFAMLERFRSSKIFEDCPYIDELFYTKDAWLDYDEFMYGVDDIKKTCEKWADENNYEVIFVNAKHGNKILTNASQLNVKLNDVHTEVFISNDDIKQAEPYIPKEPYGFVQTSTGVPLKNLPPEYGARWIRENCGINRIIEVGVDFKYDDISIGAQFYILKNASCVCLPDSVFYHASCALNKKIDLVYFGRGDEVYQRVRPQHDVIENVVYKLPKLKGN